MAGHRLGAPKGGTSPFQCIPAWMLGQVGRRLPLVIPTNTTMHLFYLFE